MSNEVAPSRHCTIGTTCKAILLVSIVALLSSVGYGRGQSGATEGSIVITMNLGADQIGKVKTSPGITTRLVFAEPVQEIICGDLYDPSSGVGTFVVQRVGNDIFLKPVTSEGLSNLFVKTGSSSERTYNFDLVIGSPQEAYRIVKVVGQINSEEPKQVKKPKNSFASPPLISAIGLPSQLPSATPAGLMQMMRVGQQPPAPPPPTAAARRSSNPAGEIPGSKRAAIRTLKPDYPQSARRIGASGEVTVQVLIDQKGNVVSAQALSGHPILKLAAQAAARLWKFEPDTRGDKSGKDRATIRFSFHGTESAVDSLLVSSRESELKDTRRH